MPVADNVVHPFPSIEARAAKAMADYKAGIADESAGKNRAIRAVIEYGKALQEGKRKGEEVRNNVAFGQWVKDNKLDIGKPWDEKQERSCAMKIATLLGSVPNSTFDSCPYTTPTNIMKWYRKMFAPATDKADTSQKPQARPRGRPRIDRTPQTDAAYEAIVKAKAEGRKISKKPFAKEIGISHMAVEKAMDRWNREQADRTNAKLNEDAALAKVEATFSEKSKLTVADAIRIHKARFDRAFEQLVGEEVRRRITAANDSVRERLKKAEQTILAFERERGKRGVFTKSEFNQMIKLCHPDDSASPETRARLLQVLLKNKINLVNPDKE